MTRTGPALTVEELRAGRRRRARSTPWSLAIADMQGRLQGKRLHAPLLPRRGARARHRGLQLPARRRRRHEHRRRLRDVVAGSAATATSPWRPTSRTLRRVPWQPGTALVLADLAWLDGAPVVASPRQILRRQLDRLAEHGLTAYAGTELEFIVYRDSYEEAWRARLPRPDPGQPVQRRLLAARHRPGRAAAAPHPQRDGRRRAARRRAPRASATSASTRSPSATTRR